MDIRDFPGGSTAKNADASIHRRSIEKRSRERIGNSLKELKRLLPNFKQHGSKTSEQMDLLQSAVDYLKSIQTSTSVDQLSWATESTTSTSSQREGPLPSLFNPPPAPLDAMMDGFQDCMEETIRYLVQVEGFPPNHDIIIRLRAHLIQSQSKLDVNNHLRTSAGHQRPCLSLDHHYRDLQRRHRAGLASRSSLHGPQDSTHTSPQLAHTNACAAYPPASALLARNGPSHDALQTTTASGPAGLSQLPLGVMTPLTVDTNQYYAMPSPLSHCLTEGALAQQNSKEPLLTIARTRPTNSAVTFSSPGNGLASRTCNSNVVGSRTAGTSVATPGRSLHPSSTAQTMAPSVATSVSGAHLGFNLNYVAPYLVAFVRPAAQ